MVNGCETQGSRQAAHPGGFFVGVGPCEWNASEHRDREPRADGARQDAVEPLLQIRDLAALLQAGQLVAAQPDAARQVAAQRQQLVDLVTGTTVLNQTSARRPTALEVMDDVTRRLPDNTYLEKLAIEGDRLTLIGFSPEASGLVARLQGSPLWRNPALSGALQPDPRTRMDRFTLTAELLGKQDPAANPQGDANAAGRD